jgi:hypothetical protein
MEQGSEPSFFRGARKTVMAREELKPIPVAESRKHDGLSGPGQST